MASKRSPVSSSSGGRHAALPARSGGAALRRRLALLALLLPGCGGGSGDGGDDGDDAIDPAAEVSRFIREAAWGAVGRGDNLFRVPYGSAIDFRRDVIYITDVLGVSGLVSKWRPAVDGEAAPPPPPGYAFPAALSAFGLFTSLPDLEMVSSRAAAYAPRWEQWTNGARKLRRFILPEGTAIDNLAGWWSPDWNFPEGTLFFVTLSYPRLADPASFRPVETQVMARWNGSWDFAAYRWNDPPADAELLDGETPVPVAIETGPGAGFDHRIPSRGQCVACHGSGRSFILGFNELQLNHTLPSHASTQLEELSGSSLFLSPAPASPQAIEAADPAELAVKGYIQGNCVHCHNGNRAFSMSHEVFLENTIGIPSRDGQGVLIAPGDAAGSLLYRHFSGGIMPPLGVQRLDTDAAAMLRSWIDSLDP